MHHLSFAPGAQQHGRGRSEQPGQGDLKPSLWQGWGSHRVRAFVNKPILPGCCSWPGTEKPRGQRSVGSIQDTPVPKVHTLRRCSGGKHHVHTSPLLTVPNLPLSGQAPPVTTQHASLGTRKTLWIHLGKGYSGHYHLGSVQNPCKGGERNLKASGA